MIISKTTINKAREIKSIELNINDNLIMKENQVQMKEVLLFMLFQKEC